MSPLGTDVVAAEAGQLIQVANDASTSTSEPAPSELCLLVDSIDIETESDDGSTVDSSICCNEMLSKPEPIDDVAVCRWIQSVIGTRVALREAHTMDILFDAVNELAPTTNWLHLMENESCKIPDEAALNFMMCVYARAWKEPSPLSVVCLALWKKIEGQNCIMKFVDMCEELKILSIVLDSAPLPFKIKVAVAASRKYHSLIVNWLGEKSDVYKGQFLGECVNLLKECSTSTEPQFEIMNISWGSFPLFVEVCKFHLGELLPTQLLKEQVRELTLKHLLQANSFDIIKYHINMLLNERQFNRNLIVEEKRKFLELKDRAFEHPFAHCRPDIFEEEYGPIVQELKTLTKSNDETLKDLRKIFLESSNPLIHEVDAIFKRNKAASKKAGSIISQYYDYHSRAKIEMLWIDGVEHKVDEPNGFLSGCATVLAELEGTEVQICEIDRRMALLSKQCTQNFYSQCHALDALAKLWGDIAMLWKKLTLLTKAAKDLCLTSKNLRILVNEKLMNATRFHNIEQLLKEEIKSSKVCQDLVALQLEVEKARTASKEVCKIRGPNKKYEQILVNTGMSWRSRLLLERNILGEMREQGRDMCAFVSTVVMRESLGKRENARYRLRAGLRYRPSEPVIKLKLSEHHLQDIVRAFYAKNKRKGSEKLDVCLERMIETGVVSESAYNRADGEAMEFDRYKISGFERLVPSNVDEAFHKLDDAVVLIGTFGITKGYFSLQPGEVYDVPPDAVLETNQVGNKLTHAVVIVGYGLTPMGRPFYVFQNWYGPTWGKDGFGMVTCRSIRQLYCAKL